MQVRLRALASRTPPLILGALIACGFLYELWRHVGAAGDFWTFWAAARATRAGLDPYLPSALAKVAPLPTGPTPGPFLSPLVLAEWLAPLGALPFLPARLLWLGLNLVLSGTLVPLLLRLGGIRLGWRSVLVGSALLMAFQPFDLTLWLGQTDIIVVTAIAVGWLCMERGRAFLGGAVLSLATLDVHLVLGVGAYLVFAAVARGQRRALGGLAAGCVALGAACLVHPADVTHWLLVTLPHAQAAAIEPWDTLSVLQAASELVGGRMGGIAAAVLDAALLTLAVRAWRHRRSTPERDLAVAAALTLATTTFAYNQDYLLLVLAFPFLARQWRLGLPGSWTGALACALAAGFGLSELAGGPLAPSHAAFVMGAPLLALGLLTSLDGVLAHLDRGFRVWAGVWALGTLVSYAAFTLSHSEIGAEVVVLAGVMAFLLLVGVGRAPGGPCEPGPAQPGEHQGQGTGLAEGSRGPVLPVHGGH